MTRGRRRTGPGLVGSAAWILLAAVIATGQFLGRAPAPDVATEPVVEPVHPPVVIVARRTTDTVRATPAPAKRPRPIDKPMAKPFAALHGFASPLIMPRLRLPRALTPQLSELSGLLTHAKPGQPVAVTLTAYCLQGTTRRGKPVRPGIIAADPHVFPLARYVELFSGGRFLGRFLVDDTGGRIHGTHIDIWTPDCDDARRFGFRTGVATLVASDR